MNFQEQNNLVIELTDGKHVNADITLLEKVAPRHRMFKRKIIINDLNKRDIDEKVVFALLDYVDKEAIIKNRKKHIDNREEEANEEKKNTDGSSQTSSQNSDSSAPKKTPKNLYPQIDWDNTENTDVQLCMILFNDAATCFHKMEEIDKEIDSKPELAEALVELEIRQKQAHAELKEYNEKKKFIWKHQILIQRKEELKFIKMYQDSIGKFMKEYEKAGTTITRYSSQINNKKYKNDKEKENWESYIEKAKAKRTLMEEILNENKTTNPQ